jgi:Zn-dependent metalloprotease
MVRNLKARVEKHPEYGVPRRIFDIESKPSREAPARIAQRFLKRIAPSLGMRPDLSQLRFDKVKESILGTHVFYQQIHDGRPVSGAWIKIDIDKDGRVFNVLNTLIPNRLLGKAKTSRSGKGEAGPLLKKSRARRLALESVGGSPPSAKILEQELVSYPHENVPVPAWKVIVRTTRPAREWRIYLDAATGEILQKIDQLKRLNGTGLVFDPNPVVVLDDTTLREHSLIPDSAYSRVTLPDLEPGGRLDGPFVSTRNTPRRVKSPAGRFLYRRKNCGFKEVMAYFHIDRIQRYIQELGFGNVMSHPIAVNVGGRTDEDNSYYSPGTRAITFGRGGVDDAEDAEIILHEYGHAVQDDIVPGFGMSEQAGAMGEGFGDYLAGSFFFDWKSARLKPCIASWDAVAYSRADPPNLRRLDSTKKFPEDFEGEVHCDGEIWSACLWELRAQLGRRVADRLAIAHHFELSRSASFEDGANAIITADKVLYRGRNEKAIRGIFVRRGVLRDPKRGSRRAGARFELFGSRGQSAGASFAGQRQRG